MKRLILSILGILIVSRIIFAAEKFMTYETTTGKQYVNKDYPSGGVISGSGTVDRIAKFTAGQIIGVAVIYESSGKIGIGLVPSYLLHIAGGDEEVFRATKTASGTRVAYFDGGYIEVGTGYGIRGASGVGFYLGANGADSAYFDTSGYMKVINRLGVNTTPSYRLHVAAADERALYVTKTASGTPIALFDGGYIEIGTGYGVRGASGVGMYLGANGADIIRLTTASHVEPATDNVHDLGNATYRWRLIRGVTITPGDLGFSETSCPACDKKFLPGEDLVLRVIGSDYEANTRTIPVHLKCKGMPITVQVRETETQYTFQDGEVKPVVVPKKVKRLKEITSIKSGYELEKTTGKFIRQHDKKAVEKAEAVEVKSQELEEDVLKTVTIK